MNSSTFFVLCAALLCASLQSTSALSDDAKAKIIVVMLPHVRACSHEYNVTPEQIKIQGKAGSLDACIVKCIMKRVGIMDDAGLFVPDRALELNRKYITDEHALQVIEEGINNCASVNTQAVNDGAEGCERAKLLVECARPYKGEFIPIS